MLAQSSIRIELERIDQADVDFGLAGGNYVAASKRWVEVPVEDVPEPLRRTIELKVEEMDEIWERPQVFQTGKGGFVLLSNPDGQDPLRPETTVEEALDRDTMHNCGLDAVAYRRAMRQAMSAIRLTAKLDGVNWRLSDLREFARRSVYEQALEATIRIFAER